MASACASCLSLMDAGVPIKKPVGGIAMGLMMDASGKYKVLTDIQGPEDHFGDMDCKIAGTDSGVTAIQMDVKIVGITKEIFTATLAQAKKARLEIIDVMKKTLAAPRPKISEFAPTILITKIDPAKIGLVIGGGGKTINGIIATVGHDTSIDIDEDGTVYTSSVNAEAAHKAMEMVQSVIREFKVGDIIEGDIIKILDFGAIVDLGGGNDGMIHVSELKEGFTKRVEDVVKLGDHVRAKVIRSEDGKIGLSIKQLK
jgi:polyribonucleotide nucleotidyltransferase